MTQDPNRIEDAARWVNRLDQPVVDTAAGAMFDRWMEEDERHRDDFADLQALWHSDILTQALQTAERPARSTSVIGRLARWRTAPPRVARIAGAAALVILTAVPALHFATSKTYVSGHGAGRSVTLADGSRVDLSGETELNVRILPWRRDATLVRGEAFFDIKHERQRPFSVYSGSTSVRVLGTAFDVDRQSQTRTIVEVYRGAVALDSGAEETRLLRKGEGAHVVDDHIVSQPLTFNIAAKPRPDWQSGWFEAADVPMAVLVAKVQRYSGRQIRFSDPSIANLAISGRFRVADPDKVLQAIQSAYGMTIGRTGESILISAPDQSQK